MTVEIRLDTEELVVQETGSVVRLIVPGAPGPTAVSADAGNVAGLGSDGLLWVAPDAFEVAGAVAAHDGASGPHAGVLLRPADVVEGDGITVDASSSPGQVVVSAASVGPYYLIWNGTDWDDPQTGGSVQDTVDPATVYRPDIPAFPQAWVVWVTITDPDRTTPPLAAHEYDRWEPHPGGVTGDTVQPPVFFDDFLGTSLSGAWGTYNDTNNQWGRFTGSLVTVQDGLLRLACEKDPDNIYRVSGVASYVNSRTYGKYEARVKLESAIDLRCVILLWPTSPETWYSGGEIDFLEVTDPARQTNPVTIHHFPTGTATPHDTYHNEYSADFTQWQTVGVIWNASTITYTLNGVAQASRVNPGLTGPMHIALQHHHRYSGPTESIDGPASSVMLVDWVKIWAA